ncbi:helix-turn-helix domain-containing protein [Brevibacterium luteolum]|uniref:XRE family transcriptional regulator n=1 Tax=Brevibacterium luteolum TaxID=199591 RepID=A0A2N6PEY2_9MICO|nr:helix-turn-helix transcriptional regulator [Brevibacterium luteolum]PMB97242.1 XRE family transcriptional regulator [Brevibacterium luteolum]
MTREDLRFATGLSAATIATMGKIGNVTTEILARSCTHLTCGLEQVAEVADSSVQEGDRNE